MPAQVTSQVKCIPTFLPADSFLGQLAACADNHDAYIRDISHLGTVNPSEVVLRLIGRCPKTVKALLFLRAELTKPFGFTDPLKHFPSSLQSIDFSAGQKLGSFTIEQSSPSELVFLFSDKHFTAHIGIIIPPRSTTVILGSTVTFSTAWGRSYYSLTKPAHTMIFKSVLNRI